MRNTLLFILTLLLALSLIGCSGTCETEDTPQCVSFVLGINKNFPKINFQSEVISDSVYDAVYSYGAVSAVVADGDPFVASDFQINEPTKKIDKDKRRQLAEDNTEKILTLMSQELPKTAETDLLKAIELSANLLHSNPEGSELTMKIVASGLITEGLLDMTAQNIVEEPIESLLRQMKEIYALPDLTNIHVVWVGFGQVTGSQESLTNKYKEKLKERCETVLLEAGAASVKFDVSPLADEEHEAELPHCSIVPIPKEKLDVAKNGESEIPEIVKWDGNSEIKFEKNQSAFINEEAAGKELKPVVSYLIENPDETVRIFGMTATVSKADAGEELSLKRAEAVRDLLVSYGAEESQILCYGLGQKNHPLRVNDLDEYGNQIEEQAQKNRAVILTKGNSETVDVLLESSTDVI